MRSRKTSSAIDWCSPSRPVERRWAWRHPRLSELVEQAHAGQVVIIAKGGIPMAKLVPLHDGPKRKIKFGTMKGEIEIAGDRALKAPA